MLKPLFDKAKNSKKTYLVARLVGIGWFVAILIAGGALGGVYLDSLIGSSPGFTISGVLLGLAVSVWGMYRMLIATLKS
ncbi:MAG: putative F0F1-ATPase subunit Ca2+/Mg2+ transporter [Chloroflexi bacterium]|jgi:F0F1-type ATP synthase assembly protein I|nr:MAG: putative F0F1-ATPase subunit Ca2+/Mg2+ transporter [Chloroflexota bacterium]|tara:strand:- start:1365 stop:1601 length:237 start_codon:yes stop_codon:yes gene_type:complete